MRGLWLTFLFIGGLWGCDSSSGPGLFLDVSPDSALLFRNDTVRLFVTPLDGDGNLVTGVAVSFASADTTIVAVSNTGLVRARSVTGRTTVRVSSGRFVTDVPVRVTGIPSAMDVFPNDTLVPTSATVQYRATVLDELGDTIPDIVITWIAQDTTIARISAAGRATAQTKAGFTGISAQAGSVVRYASLRVAVRGVATSVLLIPTDTTIPVGTSLQLRATARDAFGDSLPSSSITWSTTDSTVATVSSSGLVQSRGPNGTVVITATSGSIFDFVFVRVKTPGVPTRITLAPADTAIASGDSVQLRATVRDAFGDSVASPSLTWSSNDEAVATVSSTGMVHSEGPAGYSLIRATGGGISGNTYVTVLDTILAGRTRVTNSAYAAAISVGGVAYVVGGTVVRANLPSHSFTSGPVVGNTPTEAAFNSNGALAYITNQNSSTVSVIDVATNTELETIPVGNRPFEVIVAPGDSILWVGKIDSIYAVRLSTKAIIARFFHGAVANGVAIARDTMLYMSTHAAGTVIEFNLRTRAVARTFAVGGVPQKLAVSADGSELYIANEAGYVQFWDLGTGLQVGPNLALPASGYGIARRPSNGLLYASSQYSGGGYLYVIDPATRTLIKSTLIGGSTREVVFNADGSIGLVPNESGWVDFIK